MVNSKLKLPDKSCLWFEEDRHYGIYPNLETLELWMNFDMKDCVAMRAAMASIWWKDKDLEQHDLWYELYKEALDKWRKREYNVQKEI